MRVYLAKHWCLLFSFSKSHHLTKWVINFDPEWGLLAVLVESEVLFKRTADICLPYLYIIFFCSFTNNYYFTVPVCTCMYKDHT